MGKVASASAAFLRTPGFASFRSVFDSAARISGETGAVPEPAPPPKCSDDQLDRARLLARGLRVLRHHVGEQLRDLRLVRPADDRVPRRDVEGDADAPVLVGRLVGHVGEPGTGLQVRQGGGRRANGRRNGRDGGSGLARHRPRREVSEAGREQQSGGAQQGRLEAGTRAKRADALAEHLALEQRQGLAAELGPHRDLRVRAERRPDALQRAHLLAAALAPRQVRGQGRARRGARLARQPLHRQLCYVAAVHECSPSPKRAFRASTARKMRVLTAPTEIPRVWAISA